MELPLGAVRTADGRVEIPESKRADGSTRRAIRVRPGYVPQDEVRAYRTPAQRRREEQQQQRQVGRAVSGGAAVSESKPSRPVASGDDASDLSLASLSLGPSPPKQRKQQAAARDGEDGEVPSSQAPRSSRQGDAEAERSGHLKKELARINRLLRDVAALEKAPADSLTPAQQKTLARKSELQREKSAVIAELSGATVEQAATTTAGGKTRAVISM